MDPANALPPSISSASPSPFPFFIATISVVVEKRDTDYDFGTVVAHKKDIYAVGRGKTAKEAYEAAMAEGVKDFWRSL